ncbi:hypothetical protein MTO96_000029 [Rhipicephalus appendiculatus]
MRSRRGEAATPSHGASRSKVYDKTSILGVHLGRSNVQLYGSHGKTPAKNVIRRRCCQRTDMQPEKRTRRSSTIDDALRFAAASERRRQARWVGCPEGTPRNATPPSPPDDVVVVSIQHGERRLLHQERLLYALRDPRGIGRREKLPTSCAGEDEGAGTCLVSLSGAKKTRTRERSARPPHGQRGEPGSYIYSVAGIRAAQSGPRVRGARTGGTTTATLFSD